MAITTAITFHHLRPSNIVVATVHRWVARLENLCERIDRCEVHISQPHRSHRHGRAIEVHVVLGVPGGDIASSHVRHEDAYAAIADAFRCTRHQLIDAIAARRDFVKAPVSAEPPPQPRISLRS